VVCYWLISCEWQVIAPPTSSEKRRDAARGTDSHSIMMCTDKSFRINTAIQYSYNSNWKHYVIRYGQYSNWTAGWR